MNAILATAAPKHRRTSRPTNGLTNGAATRARHQVIEKSRGWFGRNLSKLLQLRSEMRDVFEPAAQIDELGFALGSAFSLLATNLTVTSCVGVFSAGKTNLLSLFLPWPLPSERSPTSRLYTLLEPVEGLTEPTFEIAIIGQTEARRFSALIAKRLPSELCDGARAALEKDGDVQAAAEAMYEFLLAEFPRLRNPADKLCVVDAAFLCRSVRDFVDGDETVRFEKLAGNAEFTAFEQACQHVAWDEKVQFNSKQIADGADLRASLDAWFRGDALRHIERTLSAGAPKEVSRIREIYRIGLRLGVFGYLKMRIPPNDAMRVGHLYADAPGRGGSSLLDTVMGDLVLQSASASVLVINSGLSGGLHQVALEVELKAKSAGVIFNRADERITQNESLDAAVKTLETASDEEFVKATRAIIADFAQPNLLDLHNSAGVCRRLLDDDDDPEAPGKVLLTFALYGALEHATERCRNLRCLAAWLANEEALRQLPPHLAALVKEHVQEHQGRRRVGAALAELDPGLPPRVLARVLGLLVQLGHDGGKGGIPVLLHAVERDGDLARFRQWQTCVAEIKASLKNVRTAPADAAQTPADLPLPKEYKEAVTNLSWAIKPAVATTRERLYADIRLDHYFASLHEPVEQALTELTTLALRGYAGAAASATASARAAAVDLFRRIVADLPAKLDLALDRAIEQFTSRVKTLLDETWQPIFDTAAYADAKTKQLFEKAAAGCRIYDPGAEAGVLRWGTDQALRSSWTEPLLARSPMESILDERCDPQRHGRQFRTIALRIGRQRVATALIQAARQALAVVRAGVEAWLGDVESRFDHAALAEHAGGEAANDPQTKARQRRHQARQAMALLQQECAAVFNDLDEALAPAAVEPAPA